MSDEHEFVERALVEGEHANGCRDYLCSGCVSVIECAVCGEDHEGQQ